MDVEVLGRVEAELDQLVEKRARRAAEQERIEELWAESERRDLARRRREHRALWYRATKCSSRRFTP